ncbi:cytochrome b [Gilvimarinus sp. SDUM040013]|uniref:Cytochrome b n=1 Tax=Gilvimarinus gilvus TaxID=3058038 RepID=A0ABU4RXJ7_9GAMM|nr:cytochrome b [Gilvimarinus sp. SDUM040013]MDO3388697.1 cytochrome b [Gilvimarinus sp. SDUM040013]MDX6849592.1 cytochrome b [Gilvimarinus sp. SDUM040013]
MLNDNARGYGLVTIVLHWVCALVVVFLFALGLYMTSLSYYDDWYHKGPSLHVSVGLILLALMVLRLLWRIFSRTPDPLPEHSLLIRLGASAVKIILYALIFTVMASGYLITTAEGSAPSIFGLLSFPVLIELGPDKVDLAGWVHLVFAWAIIVFASLHALAAMSHHFLIRDRTLIRILKPVKK